MNNGIWMKIIQLAKENERSYLNFHHVTRNQSKDLDHAGGHHLVLLIEDLPVPEKILHQIIEVFQKNRIGCFHLLEIILLKIDQVVLDENTFGHRIHDVL